MLAASDELFHHLDKNPNRYFLNIAKDHAEIEKLYEQQWNSGNSADFDEYVLDKIGFLAQTIKGAKINKVNSLNIEGVIKRDFIFANESGIIDKIYADLFKRADKDIATQLGS